MKAPGRIFGFFPDETIGRWQFVCCVLAGALLSSCTIKTATTGEEEQQYLGDMWFQQAKNLEQWQQQTIAELQKNLHLQVTPLGNGGISAQVLSGISFQLDSMMPTPELYGVVDHVINVLRKNRAEYNEYKIIVLGHTDNSTPKNPQISNYLISSMRADLVAHYMIDNGIKKSMISSEGKGPDHPLADNNTPEGRSVNRRIEWQILPTRGEAGTCPPSCNN
ncbi:MAG: OmpA family protein [Betaproteobacteria bacterium]|nr:OmpA family protein [Betaproteobacteria bacterium]